MVSSKQFLGFQLKSYTKIQQRWSPKTNFKIFLIWTIVNYLEFGVPPQLQYYIYFAVCAYLRIIVIFIMEYGVLNIFIELADSVLLDSSLFKCHLLD